MPTRWLVHFLRLSELWSGCRIKIYCCEIKISVNVRPDVCPRTTSLFMPISSDGLCSLPPPPSWPASMKMKSACEKGSTTEKKKKECFIYKKQVNLRLAVSTRDRLTPHRGRGIAQALRLRGRLRGGRRGTNCQCALHVVACCVLWPAGPQRQESPFNLNTYHHDNNLVTLSEANLFISRFFFSLLLSLSPLQQWQWFTHSIILCILNHSQSARCVQSQFSWPSV